MRGNGSNGIGVDRTRKTDLCGIVTPTARISRVSSVHAGAARRSPHITLVRSMSRVGGQLLGSLVGAGCRCPSGVNDDQPASQTAGKIDRGYIARQMRMLGSNGYA